MGNNAFERVSDAELADLWIGIEAAIGTATQQRCWPTRVAFNWAVARQGFATVPVEVQGLRTGRGKVPVLTFFEAGDLSRLYSANFVLGDCSRLIADDPLAVAVAVTVTCFDAQEKRIEAFYTPLGQTVPQPLTGPQARSLIAHLS